MNVATLSHPSARFQKACRILDDLHRQAAAVYAEHEPVLEAYPYEAERKLRFTIDKVPPIPPARPGMIKDIVVGGRGSLDYLAYQLAIVANGDKPLYVGARSRVWFPISKDKHDFDSQAGRLTFNPFACRRRARRGTASRAPRSRPG